MVSSAVGFTDTRVRSAKAQSAKARLENGLSEDERSENGESNPSLSRETVGCLFFLKREAIVRRAMPKIQAEKGASSR